MTAGEILREARVLIRFHWRPGWPSGSVCIATAIAHAAGIADPLRTRRLDVLPAAVSQACGILLDCLGVGVDPRGLCQWNDDPTRTKAEVLTLFDAAIAIADEPPVRRVSCRGVRL